MRFFDTNVLVYAATDQDPRKNRIAAELISHAIQVNHDGCISTQVLQEFCNTMYKKTKRTKFLKIDKSYFINHNFHFIKYI